MTEATSAEISVQCVCVYKITVVSDSRLDACRCEVKHTAVQMSCADIMQWM